MRSARVAVAYSGGRDSTALLHATLRAAAPLGIEVLALHVHHGLSPNADVWLERCRATCAAWTEGGAAVGFIAQRVRGRPGKGESVEAWARQARYAGLHAMAAEHDVTLVLLGQHRRDQAETLLLQALRGAGVAGLAAMPKQVERGGVVWARPWLGAGRAAIDAYVDLHGLQHVEDESNADPRFDRNRLRLQVWPRLVEAFPQAEAALAASAQWAQEAAGAMAELAAMDLAIVAADGRLRVAAWSALSAARRSNALRAWLRLRTGEPATPALVARLAAELGASGAARWPAADGELRSYRGVLDWQRAVSMPPDGASLDRSAGRSPVDRSTGGSSLDRSAGGSSLDRRDAGSSLRILRAGVYPIAGWTGALKATRSREGGVALATLERLELSERRGAERFQAGPGRPPRSLKKQFQSVGVPAWQRDGPLVYSQGRLVFVPGLGIDARVLAKPGEAQMKLDWIATAVESAPQGRR